jgi:transcriptional regulator with XRE-family HTH domain
MGQFSDRVARNIKKYRKEKGMTLKELAEKVGITEATMQKYEAGNIKSITMDMFYKIAQSLDIPSENLSEWEDGELEEYRKQRKNDEESKLLKKYSMLSKGHKRAVRSLIDSLLECQERNHDKNKPDTK